MREWNEFGIEKDPREQQSAECVAWAVLLPEAAEGLLNEAELRGLDQHIASCSSCAQELADARRGAAWLTLLKQHAPEPPAALLGSILARTTGAEDAALHTLGAASVLADREPPSGMQLAGATVSSDPSVADRPLADAGVRSRIRRWLGIGDLGSASLQPRLTMTAAMAFFSVCLTLNLVGLSVHNVSAETLHPAGLQRAVAEKSAQLVRSFVGIRAVYRVESRVNEWVTASAEQGETPLSTGK